MTVQTWRREYGREAVDQFQRGEGQSRATIAPGLWQTINDLLLADLFDTLQGERRARPVTQQPLDPGAVVTGDAHRGVERKGPRSTKATAPAGAAVVGTATTALSRLRQV